MDKTASVVAVQADTRAVPARQTPRRIRLCGETDGDARVGTGDALDVDLEIDGDRARGEQWVVRGGEV